MATRATTRHTVTRPRTMTTVDPETPAMSATPDAPTCVWRSGHVAAYAVMYLLLLPTLVCINYACITIPYAVACRFVGDEKAFRDLSRGMSQEGSVRVMLVGTAILCTYSVTGALYILSRVYICIRACVRLKIRRE